MYELDNLDQKQLRGLSLRLKSNAKKVIEDSDYKIPDDYFGVESQLCWKIRILKTNTKMNFGGLFYPERWQEDRWKNAMCHSYSRR